MMQLLPSVLHSSSSSKDISTMQGSIIAAQVLRSVPLRSWANQMAYYDKQTLATEDAMRIGRLHTFLPGEDAHHSMPKTPFEIPLKLAMQGLLDLAHVPVAVLLALSSAARPH